MVPSRSFHKNTLMCRQFFLTKVGEHIFETYEYVATSTLAPQSEETPFNTVCTTKGDTFTKWLITISDFQDVSWNPIHFDHPERISSFSEEIPNSHKHILSNPLRETSTQGASQNLWSTQQILTLFPRVKYHTSSLDSSRVREFNFLFTQFTTSTNTTYTIPTLTTDKISSHYCIM